MPEAISERPAIEPLWTPEETAKYLGLDPDTLAVWRCTKRHGLPFIYCGARIMYSPAQVRSWVASRTVGPDGVTPKGVKRRRGGPGKPPGGWPSQRRKSARKAGGQ